MTANGTQIVVLQRCDFTEIVGGYCGAAFIADLRTDRHALLKLDRGAFEISLIH